MLCLNDTVNTWACLLVAYPLPLHSRQDSSNTMDRVLNETVIKWECLLVAKPPPFRQDTYNLMGCVLRGTH